MLSTKLVVIFAIAIIINVQKELLLFLLFYSPLRGLGFGFHANNSIECWLISVPVFILIPFLAKTIVLSPIIIHAFIVLSSISFLLFGPADTPRKPLINKKKRLINKTLLVLISIGYLFSTLFIKSNMIINTIMFACLWQAICVNPLLYKLFHQPFNSYKKYLNTV